MEVDGVSRPKKRKHTSDSTPPGKDETWREWKKKKKEQYVKWKEQKLMKKLAKQELKAKEKAESDRSIEAKGRNYTVSIALPGSILDNAQSLALRTYLAGQIARAASVFNVNEIVIFRENQKEKIDEKSEFDGIKKHGRACEVMSAVLQMLECPQYLRKNFFPHHQDLQYAGVLNPLDAPHHVRIDEEVPFREGCTIASKAPGSKGTLVNVGLAKPVRVDTELEPNLRVTVRMISPYSSKKLKGEVVSPNTPCEETGTYWGYEVRIAESFHSVFTKCPYENGYDLTIGTSDGGSSVDDVTFPQFRHLLIVFGGLNGLESYIEEEERLTVSEPQHLFNYYLNTCPGQGSRTIRTEEAILISLSCLRKKIIDAQSG